MNSWVFPGRTHNNTVSTDVTCTGMVSTETKVSVTNSRTFSISSGTYTVVVNRGSSSNPLPYSSGTAVTFTSYNYAYSGTWTYTSSSTSPESSTVSVAPTNATEAATKIFTIATNPFSIKTKSNTTYNKINATVTFTSSTTVNGVAVNLTSGAVKIYQSGKPVTVSETRFENVYSGYPSGMESLIVNLSNGDQVIFDNIFFEGSKYGLRITVNGSTYREGANIPSGATIRVYFTLSDYGISEAIAETTAASGGGEWGGK